MATARSLTSVLRDNPAATNGIYVVLHRAETKDYNIYGKMYTYIHRGNPINAAPFAKVSECLDFLKEIHGEDNTSTHDWIAIEAIE